MSGTTPSSVPPGGQPSLRSSVPPRGFPPLPPAVPAQEQSSPAPPALGDDEVLDLLRLYFATSYRFELGARLLKHFGRAADVLRQSAKVLAETGVTPAIAKKLVSAAIGRRAEEELELVRREAVTLLCSPAAIYPPPLRETPDAPLVLFARGALSPTEWLTIGIVGSRRPTLYAIRQTRRFAGTLARGGVAVVSGLARGVDGESHRAALDEGGRTVAVLGSGLGQIYPREHETLAARIWNDGRGMVLTPFPYRAAPRSFHFPVRNSVLSGLSLLLLVVEAGEKSGSLITVDHALRQGKSVYALPGRVDQSECRGSLRLLRDGAGIALAPDDLFLALLAEGEGLPENLRHTVPARGALIGRNATETSGPTIDGPFGEDLTALYKEADTWHPDALAQRLGVDVRALLRELTRLEMAGKLRRLPGGLFACA